jgi:hypothetical protein
MNLGVSKFAMDMAVAPLELKLNQDLTFVFCST